MILTTLALWLDVLNVGVTYLLLVQCQKQYISVECGSQGAEHLCKLSGGVWGYGLTCNIRWCQRYIQQRDVCCQKCVHQNVNCAPILRYCDPSSLYAS